MIDYGALSLAIAAAKLSPCRSKRGVAIWDSYGTVSVGFNHQPAPFVCDGSELCRGTCSRTGIHAEQAALIRAARSRLHGAQMLHIKVVDGQPVNSGPPSCVMCSKEILFSGLAGMWLRHAEGWRFYDAATFHKLSAAAAGSFVKLGNGSCR